MLFFFIFPIIHTLRLSFIDPNNGLYTFNNYFAFFSKEGSILVNNLGKKSKCIIRIVPKYKKFKTFKMDNICKKKRKID